MCVCVCVCVWFVCVCVCVCVCIIQAWREGRAAQAGCLGIWLSIVAWQPHTISSVLSPSPPPPPPLLSLSLPSTALPLLSLYCTVALTPFSFSTILIPSLPNTAHSPHCLTTPLKSFVTLCSPTRGTGTPADAMEEK